MSSLLTAWAALFITFGLLFGAVFSGSRFKPQAGETVAKSFFLVFYKEKPGRFVVTDRRVIFVPEAFSQWFGATRLSLDLVDIESIHHTTSTIRGGHVAILASNGAVYHFAMPVLVLEPLMVELKKLQLSGGPEIPIEVEQKAKEAATTTEGATTADTTGGDEKSLFSDDQEGVELVEILHIEPTDPPSTPDESKDSAREESANEDMAKAEAKEQTADETSKDDAEKSEKTSKADMKEETAKETSKAGTEKESEEQKSEKQTSDETSKETSTMDATEEPSKSSDAKTDEVSEKAEN